jgi:hypothetical protein
MGGKYAMLMCLAAFGYVIADVAADGLTVQYARREPLEQRGSTQASIYLIRTVGSVSAARHSTRDITAQHRSHNTCVHFRSAQSASSASG